MSEFRHRLRSNHLGNERHIWVRPPPDGRRPTALLVFLDAELYRERVQAPETVAALDLDTAMPATISVYVSCANPEARWVECPCHPPFATFVIEELIPWLEHLHPGATTCPERVLIGLSYTGLAASYIALQNGNPFTTVISQSGSYWWNDGWLTRQYAALTTPRPVRFYLEAGLRETQTNVRHKEDVLQVTSQLESIRRFRDVLVQRGHAVHYSQFDGGHEYAWWSRTLPDALRWAMTARA